MKRLDNLSQVVEHQLGGLQADAKLLAKIKLQAAESGQTRRTAMLRPVLAVCAALVLCVGAAAWSVQQFAPQGSVLAPDATPNVMDSYAAGEATLPTNAPRIAGDVPSGSITMSAGSSRSGDTLFATGEGSAFPLISVNGATYRLLRSPSGVSRSLLGGSLGAVTEFNHEPALSSGGVVSNVVSLGEQVYAVDGMGGALAAAYVNDGLRVFQRVSYAGTAVIGRETLADTLCDPEQVEWIDVSGYGRAQGADAQRLMQTLLDCAEYLGSGSGGTGSMQVGLRNGLTLQLFVGEDTVSACGTWSCPDFFDMMRMAAGNE